MPIPSQSGFEDLVKQVGGGGGSAVIDKALNGLDQVNNTSDANKPISSATQTALDATVKLTGNQSVAGIKTFTSAPVVPDASFGTAKVSGLDTALSGKAATSHTHTASQVTDLTSTVQGIVNTQLNIAGAPALLDTIDELAAAINDDANFFTTISNLIAQKEPIITAGTSTQFWRGDKTWQTLNTSAISGLQTLLDAKAPLASPTFTGTVSGITKSMVGLSNVPNTDTTNAANISSGVLGIDRNTAGSIIVNKYNSGTSSYPVRPTSNTNIIVDWEGPVAPTIGGSYAVDGLDRWTQTP